MVGQEETGRVTKEHMHTLIAGDCVRHKASGVSYIVTANYGERVTAVRTADITHPDEWEIVYEVYQYVDGDVSTCND